MTRLAVRPPFALALALAAVAGCSGEDPTSSANPQEVAVAMTTASAPIAAVGAAVAPTGDLGTPAVAPGDGGLGEDEAKTSLESDVSTGLVTIPSCVTFSWSALRASVTFDHCVIRMTGQVLNGTVAATLGLQPLAVGLEFDNLSLDARTLDGTAGISFGGEMNPGVFVTADLAASGTAGDVHLDEVAISGTPGGVSLDGGADVTVSGATARADATAVHWNLGDCLPSSGSLAIDTGGPAVTVTFLATTPADGIVQVQVGTDPPSNLPYFTPCPSE